MEKWKRVWKEIREKAAEREARYTNLKEKRREELQEAARVADLELDRRRRRKT